MEERHVVIIGCGFAGLWAVRTLGNRPGIRVTLVDKNNYHVFQPLLYQVGAAEIEPEQIAFPVRSLLRRYRNVTFLRASVSRIDTAGKSVTCNGIPVPYDRLIIATGSLTHYYGIQGASGHTFSLKSLDDAMILRNHILTCFERASFQEDPVKRARLLTFVIIGGGPTGVEFAGALSELIRRPLRRDFPGLDMTAVSVHLVEASPAILGVFTRRSGDYARRTLERMGVMIHTGAAVESVSRRGVHLAGGAVLESETVLWTAGVRGYSPDTGGVLVTGPGQRIAVTEYLTVPGHGDIHVAGDLALFQAEGKALPMVASVAIQQGRHAAWNILREQKGREPVPFIMRDRGAMATIGRNSAVTRIGGIEIRGYPAWILWLVIHIMYLIGFRNRLFVMVNWMWDYLFYDKSVRLILPRCCDDPGAEPCIHRCQDRPCAGSADGTGGRIFS